MTLPILWDDDSPRVRKDDPITSHQAADVSDTAGSRRAVLLIMQAWRTPLADFQIEKIHDDAGGRYTGQRLRTARAELVERGLITHDGVMLSPNGYRTQTWRLK